MSSVTEGPCRQILHYGLKVGRMASDLDNLAVSLGGEEDPPARAVLERKLREKAEELQEACGHLDSETQFLIEELRAITP